MYFERATSSKLAWPFSIVSERGSLLNEQLNFPTTDFIRLCIEQIHTCDVENYRNLNKLAILITLITSLLRVNNNIGSYTQNENSNIPNGCTKMSHNRIYLKLIRSLLQVIFYFVTIK